MGRKQLIKIHDAMKGKLKEVVEKLSIQCDVISASSFSADMNLSHESDIDFFLSIDDKQPPETVIKLSNALAGLSLAYKKFIYNDELRNYHSFETIIKEGKLEVEIEAKVNFNKFIKSNLILHEYIDTRLPSDFKILFTYGKLMLLKHPKQYQRLKMIFYTYVCRQIKNYAHSFILPNLQSLV